MSFVDTIGRIFGSRAAFAPAARAARAKGAAATAVAGVFVKPPATIEAYIAYKLLSTNGKRFDVVAVDLGFVDAAEMERVLAGCRAARRRGEAVTTASCAVALGVLSVEQVQAVVAAQTLLIHVEWNTFSTPAFITWAEDLKKRGFRLQIERVPAKDLLDMRDQLGSDLASQDDDRNLDQVEKAIELFLSAAKIRASDIKITVGVRDAEVQIRSRGDYLVSETWSMNRDAGERLIRAIFVGLATVKPGSYNPLDFQDAQITARLKLPGSGLESIRLIRGPKYPSDQKCSFMFARLQYNPDAEVNIATVLRPLSFVTPAAPPGVLQISGLTPVQRGLLQELLYKPHGIVVVTGPTGSGKTTSLYECMKEQARLFPTANQITVENPLSSTSASDDWNTPGS